MSTTINTKRDSLIEQIRKLRRMTESLGASESEAAFATARVAKLISEYNIDESELRLKADAIGMVDDVYSTPGPITVFQTRVAIAIEELTHTKCRWRTVMEDAFGLGDETEWTHIKYYGYPLDVEAALSLTAICQTSLITQMAAWQKANKIRKNIQKASFHHGICVRLAERIRDLSAVGAKSTGTSLMITKNTLVSQHYAAFLRQKGMGLRHGLFDEIILDEVAAAAGRSAGDNVNLRRNLAVEANA